MQVPRIKMLPQFSYPPNEQCNFNRCVFLTGNLWPQLWGAGQRLAHRGTCSGSDLCLLPTHFKATSGCGHREGAVVEGRPDSLETILSLFLLPHLWASFEFQLEGNKLSHLQACIGLTVNVNKLQWSNSHTQDPCLVWAEQHHPRFMLVSVLERRVLWACNPVILPI